MNDEEAASGMQRQKAQLLGMPRLKKSRHYAKPRSDERHAFRLRMGREDGLMSDSAAESRHFRDVTQRSCRTTKTSAQRPQRMEKRRRRERQKRKRGLRCRSSFCRPKEKSLRHRKCGHGMQDRPSIGRIAALLSRRLPALESLQRKLPLKEKALTTFIVRA